MDIGKEVREVEFESPVPEVSPINAPEPVRPVPEVSPTDAPEPVHSDPAPDKEPAHAAAVQLLHR